MLPAQAFPPDTRWPSSTLLHSRLACLAWSPAVLSETTADLLQFAISRPAAAAVIAAGTLAPTLPAFIMTATAEGKTGIHRLLRRYVLWRVRIRWYQFVLLVIPASVVLGAIVLPEVPASYQALTIYAALSYPIAFVLTFILGGPLGEEPGWRAGVCAAPLAAVARPFGRKCHPGNTGACGTSLFLEWTVNTAHHPQHCHVHLYDHRLFDNCLDMGLQQCER
jgi:hypothetical protein